MRKILAILLSIALGLSMLLATTGCGKQETGAKPSAEGEKNTVQPVRLKVGVLAAMTALPIVDIVNKGIDKQNGLEIEMVKFTTGAPMNEAMAAGQIDVSCIGAAGVFALASYDAKMIAEICDDTVGIDLVVRPDSPAAKEKGVNKDFPNIYGSADSLKGKTFLAPAGTLSQYEVGKYIDAFGLKMEDIKLVPMEYAQAYQAFKAGEGDVLATRSPQCFTAVDVEGWLTAASLKDLKSTATAQLVVRNDIYQSRFDALVKLTKLMHESNARLNNDIEYSAKLMSDWFAQSGQKIELDIAKKQLAAKPFFSPEDVKQREFGNDLKTTITNFMISSGQLKESDRTAIESNIKSDVIKAAGLK